MCECEKMFYMRVCLVPYSLQEGSLLHDVFREERVEHGTHQPVRVHKGPEERAHKVELHAALWGVARAYALILLHHTLLLAHLLQRFLREQLKVSEAKREKGGKRCTSKVVRMSIGR